ncbi:MAG: HIT family protein [Bacteroidota bacterium]
MRKKTEVISPSCCICAEVSTGKLPLDYHSSYPLTNRICMENEHFIVVPSISPIVEGHLLIFPKDHINNLAEIKQNSLNKFFEIVNKSIAMISSTYDQPFIFEHGVGQDGFLGCGIDHAHLHIIPLNSEVSSNAIKKISSTYFNFTNGSLKNILSNADKFNSYLLFGNDIEKMCFVADSNIPSQFIRKIIINELNGDEWDWKKYSGRDKFIKTYETIKEYHFQTIY